MKLSSLKSGLAVWQATHKELLDTDAQYRKRFHSFLAAIVFLSCILAVFYLPFFGVKLFAPFVDVAIVLGLAGLEVALALRQFHYQGKRIRDYLKLSHDGRGSVLGR